MTGGLKGQDFIKMIIVILVIVGVFLMTFGVGDWYVHLFEEV